MVESARAFVTGCPVSHSRSPQIHRYWLAFYNIAGQYEPVETTAAEFPVFLCSLAAQNWRGGNVTLPHKEQAFALAEKHDDVSAQIGAVNTLWLEGGVLCGTNTDAYGFVHNLDDFAAGWARETALVIGAGGASRAVIFALKQRGFKHIALVNRTRSRADDLAAHFGPVVVADNWQRINDHMRQADLIVNTTSLGMNKSGAEKTDQMMTAFDFASAPAHAVVTDIVYTPLMTAFLQKARDNGLKTVDGLGMLLHQAAPGFERWFGVMPQVTPALRAHILHGMREEAS